MNAKSRADTTDGLTVRSAHWHPAIPIPNIQIEEFLKDFGDGTPGLDLLEVEAFTYIKSTANTEANIQATNRGYNCF